MKNEITIIKKLIRTQLKNSFDQKHRKLMLKEKSFCF